MHEISAYNCLMANLHLSTDGTDEELDTLPNPAPPEDSNPSDQVLINAAKQSKFATSPADIQQVLSSKPGKAHYHPSS